MKKNLEYFSHSCHTFNGKNCRLLLNKYGMQGYGTYFYLCEMIGLSDDCQLNVLEEMDTLLLDLNISQNELLEFIDFLSVKCKMINFQDGVLTHPVITENYTEVSKQRKDAIERAAIAREKKKQKHAKKQNEDSAKQQFDNSSYELMQSSPELLNNSPEFLKSSSDKLNQTKLNEIKANKNKTNETKEKKETHENTFKPTSPDGIEVEIIKTEILNFFLNEYKKAFSREYLVVDSEKEEYAARGVYYIFRKIYKDLNTPELLKHVFKYIRNSFGIRNQWLRNNLNLNMLANKYNEICAEISTAEAFSLKGISSNNSKPFVF